jgi:hypothetical protein
MNRKTTLVGQLRHDFEVTLFSERIGGTWIRLIHHSDSSIRAEDFMEPIWYVSVAEDGKGTTTARYDDGVQAREKFDEAVSEAAYRCLVGGQ